MNNDYKKCQKKSIFVKENTIKPIYHFLHGINQHHRSNL